MSAAAVIVYRQRQFVIRFLEDGATKPATVRSLDDLGIRSHWIFRRMVREGVFRMAFNKREQADNQCDRFEQRQRRCLVTFVGVFVIAFILLLLLLLLR